MSADKLTANWEELDQLGAEVSGKLNLRRAFSDDPARFERYSAALNDLFVDYSKNLITDDVMAALGKLAKAANVEEWRDRMFAGDKINVTENRAVLHTALRNLDGGAVELDGEDVMPAVKEVLARLKAFATRVHSGEWKGHTGKKITDVVNIGIGGSDLGPVMVNEALRPFHIDGIRCRFVSNVDGAHIVDTLKNLDAETTLFIIASKTFTTDETLTNAYSARDWLVKALGDESAVAKHFVAVSTALDKVAAFGIDTDNAFGFWDWVGGRYSLWSAIGLPIILAVGYEKFEELLRGAQSMDNHFKTAPIETNIPMILALIGVWYRNVLGASSQAILPYDQHLSRLPAYLQQADMESNGKSVTRDGKAIAYETGPIIWGEPGTNGQHAFYQLIHQGTELIPVDFIVAANALHPLGNHHDKLVSNCLAQAEALMRGKTEEEVRAELEGSDLSPAEIDVLAPQKVFAGNKPSTMILYKQLDAFTLGRLVAMYEHKIFVQGIIWNVNSYDQWGVELGKQLAKELLPMVEGKQDAGSRDSSTVGLIKRLHALRG
ncbi:MULTISPECIES: glucose-6-phosphate isomerase [Thalassospira]|uniref:Glucose-6-phosphate isomerase n=2 Tax=Thalassospira TaxID=168934 RepID=A0A367W1W9_9PROT|nr:MULTISPECIES: glucose-6-phosphate isomerase [Thalassospira]MDG4719501.1 glucose-6-phosphate isomerase [Thalassospira sp. FZY0004]RCK33777.1 glucose-6-phosphate isomerase [Thalassospira profundimaris]